MNCAEMQAGEILVDMSPSGKERPWRIHKLMNEMLTIAYDDVNSKKADRLRTCATVLGFVVDENKRKRLKAANFCRVRLCPTCMWRRSLKVQSQMHAIMDAMKADVEGGGKEYAFIYLTLTVKNVAGDKLGEAMSEMNKGFERLIKTEKVSDAVRGFFKSMEVTHNLDRDDPWFDTYHHHLHVVLAVPPYYFKSRIYISHAKWKAIWKKAMRLDYNPSVRINKVKGITAKAIAEAAGYGAKSDCFIIPDDWDMTVETVRLLDKVLHKRRFVSFGGVFADYHRRLNLQRPEEGDLIHVGDEPNDDLERGKKCYYAWFSGYRQYRGVE